LVRDPLTLLADRVDGQPLPEDHGGPLRLVVSRQLGYKSVKWVDRLEVTDRAVIGTATRLSDGRPCPELK
jgi:DMSO/TMAO reductase YedYZ molybdopterin-dependent catalytic subunit